MGNKKLLLLFLAFLPFSVNSADVVFNPATFGDIASLETATTGVPNSSPIYNSDYAATRFCEIQGYTFVSKSSPVYTTGVSTFGGSTWSVLGGSAWSTSVITCSSGVDVYGCTDPQATNYNPNATIDDNSCYRYGCTISTATNYDPLATINDNSCYNDYFFGCTDPQATNYNPNATIDDNSCYIAGCTDPQATNYNSGATIENNSCLFSGSGSFIIQNNIEPTIDGGLGEDIFTKDDIVSILYFEFVILFLLSILVYIQKLVYGRTKVPSKII